MLISLAKCFLVREQQNWFGSSYAGIALFTLVGRNGGLPLSVTTLRNFDCTVISADADDALEPPD